MSIVCLLIVEAILVDFTIKPDICLPLVSPGKALDDMILFDDYHKSKISKLQLSGLAPN